MGPINRGRGGFPPCLSLSLTFAGGRGRPSSGRRRRGISREEEWRWSSESSIIRCDRGTLAAAPLRRSQGVESGSSSSLRFSLVFFFPDTCEVEWAPAGCIWWAVYSLWASSISVSVLIHSLCFFFFLFSASPVINHAIPFVSSTPSPSAARPGGVFLTLLPPWNVWNFQGSVLESNLCIQLTRPFTKPSVACYILRRHSRCVRSSTIFILFRASRVELRSYSHFWVPPWSWSFFLTYIILCTIP